MGISIQQYRQAIGLFNGAKLIYKSCLNYLRLSSYFCIGLCNTALMILLLLLAGDVELNPGPDSQTTGNISICQLNVHSLPDKLSAIKNSLAKQYDIIALTETLLRPYHQQDLNINEFHPVIRLDRQDRGGGGSAVYVRSTLHYTRLSFLEIPEIEALWLKIRSQNNVFILCICYRPPDMPNIFWEHFQEQIDTAKQIGINYMLITGDLNADPNSENGPYLQQFANQNHFRIHVNEPTRITINTATILDQFVSNLHEMIHNVTVLPPVSHNDHCTITAELKFKTHKSSTYKRHVWFYDKADFNAFRRALELFNWDVCFENNDVDDVCNSWTQHFLAIAKSFIPNRYVTIRPSDSPWYTGYLRKIKRKLDRIHGRAKRSNNPDIWASYREHRNEYNREIKKAEQEYNLKLASNLQNKSVSSKQWWKLAKSFLGYNNETSYPPIKDGDNIHFDNKGKAQAFNDFFIKHCTINTDGANLPNSENINHSELSEVFIEEREILDLLKSIDTSKSTGPDGISPRMLKEAAIVIYPSLCRLINLSLSTCKVPSEWKKAHVLPLHKKKERDILDNYRPVSLLSCVSKILERAIFKHVFNFFRDNFLITVYQSGFTPGDSTVNQLVHIYHLLCDALDKKKEVRIVFCDISKAFDRVWHEGLIYKLRNMGIRGDLLSWFKDYLSNRYQRVVLEGEQSSWSLIKAGVPQGSVLGPLLFLVYINDISDNVNSNIRLFADDTTIFVEVDNPETAAETLNNDLKNMNDWANQWLVTFSPPKTKSMIVSYKHDVHHPPIFLDDTQIDVVSSHKHLGITLSDNLKWDDHVRNSVLKAGQRVDVLSRLMYKIDRHSLNVMYKTFIRPTLEYGDVLLCNLTENQKYDIEMVQKRAGRIICGATRGTTRNVIYGELAWETLEKRRERHCILYFHKILHGQTPAFLSDLIPGYVYERVPYNLRNAQSVDLVPARITALYNSFIPYTIRLWNNLPQNLRALHEFDTFKVEYLRDLPKDNVLYCYGNRKAGIHHARIRMGCSILNHHLYKNHILDSPQCRCGHSCEDALHFFFVCELFSMHRIDLHDIVIEYAPFNLHTILYGRKDLPQSVNQTIFDAVHKYIIDTSRFF